MLHQSIRGLYRPSLPVPSPDFQPTELLRIEVRVVHLPIPLVLGPRLSPFEPLFRGQCDQPRLRLTLGDDITEADVVPCCVVVHVVMDGGLLQVFNNRRCSGAQSADELEAVFFETVVHPTAVEPTIHTNDIVLNVVLWVRQHLVYLVLDAPAPLDALRRQRHRHFDIGEADTGDLKCEGRTSLLVHAFDTDGLVLVRDIVSVKPLPVLVLFRRVATISHQVGQIHCQVGPVGKIAVLVENHD